MQSNEFNHGKRIKEWACKKLAFMATEFIILFAFWLLLSGHYDFKHIIMGVISACVITILTHDIFFPAFFLGKHGKKEEENNLLFIVLSSLRIILYLPWLLYQILIANFRVAYLVLHPKMPISPALIKFQTELQRGISQVTLANSITLTPGTVTIDLKDGNFIIHALEPGAAQSLTDGEMQRKVGVIFNENKEKPPNIIWAYSIEELNQ